MKDCTIESPVFSSSKSQNVQSSIKGRSGLNIRHFWLISSHCVGLPASGVPTVGIKALSSAEIMTILLIWNRLSWSDPKV